jgi:hypothetical protein
MAFGEVDLVHAADAGEMLFERMDERTGEHRDPFAAALGFTDDDLPVAEIEILDAQAQAFHQAQASAIEELAHEAVGPVEKTKDEEGLILAEDGGHTAAGAGANGVEGFFEGGVEDIAVEEEDSAEGLVLSSCGHMRIDGEVGKEGLKVNPVEGGGVLSLVEFKEACDPGQVGLSRARGVVAPLES